jgi:hypothetical protein
MSKEDVEGKEREESIQKELLENAKKVSNTFTSMIEYCIKKNRYDRLCSCGTIDFTQLNNYNLRLTNDDGNMLLELLNSELLPVRGETKDLGNFVIGPIDSTRGPYNHVGYDDYLKPNSIANRVKIFNSQIKYILFSKDKTTFRRNVDYGKSEGKMHNIDFVKLTEDTIVVADENRYWTRRCGEKINCVKNYVIYQKGLSEMYERNELLPPSKFQICQNMEPNYCFQYNDQFVGNIDECATIKFKSTIGCSKDFQAKDNLIDYKKLKKSMVKQITSRGETFTKFKYVYNFNDLIAENRLGKINDLISKLKKEGLDIKILFIDTLKPFDAIESNGASLFTNKLFDRFYDEDDVIVLVAVDDNKAEIIFGESTINKLGLTKTKCNYFLNKLDIQNTIVNKLENILEEIQKRIEELEKK